MNEWILVGLPNVGKSTVFNKLSQKQTHVGNWSGVTVGVTQAEITSNNQESIMSLPLWNSIPLAVIYAPIVEESLFRGCIRRFIKDDKIFIIVSAELCHILTKKKSR